MDQTRIAFTTKKSHLKYKEDVQYWRASIHFVLAKHSAFPKCRMPEIYPFPAGFNPRCWKLEQDVLRLLTSAPIPDGFRLHLPEVIAAGTLYQRNDPWLYEDPRRWVWPYTIQRYIKGYSFRDLYPKLSDVEKPKVSRYLGRKTHNKAVLISLGASLRIIHSTPFGGSRKLPGLETSPWAGFQNLLQTNYRNSVVKLMDGKLLSEQLLKDLPHYLPAHVEDLYEDVKLYPNLLHGDLTDDHVLGLYKKGKWKPVGVIDFGDAIVGDKLYDLIPIYIDFFRCAPEPTLLMMQSYGMGYWNRKGFSYKAMVYTLLHAQDALRTVWKYRPELRQCQSLKELETKMWGWYQPGEDLLLDTTQSPSPF